MSEAMRVLIVEDDPEIQEAHKYFLKDLNLNFDTAESLQDALRLLNKKTYHLAIVDIMLKDDSRDRGGIEVIKQIGSLDEGTKIVVVSATNDVHVPIEVFRCGIVDFLHKSDNKREILMKIVQDALTQQECEKKAFGKYGSLNAYLAVPDIAPQWEGQMYGTIGSTYGHFVKALWDLFKYFIPILRIKNATYSFKEHRQTESISGMFWSKAKGSSIWVSFAGKNGVFKEPNKGIIGAEICKHENEHSGIKGCVWELKGVQREDFFESVKDVEKIQK